MCSSTPSKQHRDSNVMRHMHAFEARDIEKDGEKAVRKERNENWYILVE